MQLFREDTPVVKVTPPSSARTRRDWLQPVRVAVLPLCARELRMRTSFLGFHTGTENESTGGYTSARRRPPWPSQTHSPGICLASPKNPRCPPPAGLTLRPAQAQDADGLAKLVAQREGTPRAEVRERYLHELHAPAAENRLLLIAAQDAEVIAFGRAKYVKSARFAPEEPAGPVPDGWYLSGMIVDPAWRRRGIGAELTRRRLAWVAERDGGVLLRQFQQPALDRPTRAIRVQGTHPRLQIPRRDL